MKSALSAFLDDELEDRQQATVLSAMARDDELRQAWDSYHLIGDALRRAPALDRRLTASVMERLERDPVLLAPQLRRAERPLRSMLALAATAAGVALVAWIALGTQAPTKVERLALRAPATSAPVVVTVADSRMQELMVAHQAYSPANRIIGGTAYVRTFSVAAEGTAR